MPLPFLLKRREVRRKPLSLQSLPVSATANAAGTATAMLPVVPIGAVWVVSQITVTTNSAAITSATITYSGQPVDTTTAGNNDTAAGDPTLQVTQKDSLTVTWTGCNLGDICTAIFYYDYGVRRAVS